MNRPHFTPSAKRRTYVIDEPEAIAPWAASLQSRQQEAFGLDELGQRALDLLSSSLTAQTLKSYAGILSQFADFCRDSENITPLEATTAIVVRYVAWIAPVAVLERATWEAQLQLAAWSELGRDWRVSNSAKPFKLCGFPSALLASWVNDIVKKCREPSLEA
eukprot:jgi/Tetstr1/454663/TSEL_041553.t1